jgi:mono/diheme cytochrome c family protein
MFLIAAVAAACTGSPPRTGAASTANAAGGAPGASVAADSRQPGADSAARARVGMGGRMAGGRMGGAMAGMMRGGSMMGSMSGDTSADTSAAPTVHALTADSAADCPPVNQPLVDRGRTVFSATGNCFACHGANAGGTALAPNLTDPTWLDIDGSYAAIANLVRVGVPSPKAHATPMPPLGGAPLSDAQVCAVAAYVYSLGHR